MCLGVPGRVVGRTSGSRAVVDIGGASQAIDVSLLADDPPSSGDWVLVHLGFAMARMTETEAHDALEALVTIGPGTDAFDEQALYAAWGLEERASPS